MEAIQRNGRESSDGRSQTAEVMGRLVATRRRVVAEKVEPLKAEAERAAQEIETLRDTARRKVWEVIVQVRELHDRICDASARLEHLQLDIREQTGEVRLPSVPMPFADFLMGEIRRFVVTTATPEGRMLRPLDD